MYQNYGSPTLVNCVSHQSSLLKRKKQFTLNHVPIPIHCQFQYNKIKLTHLDFEVTIFSVFAH